MRKPVPGGLDEELGADVAAALHHDPLHVARVLVVLQGALVQAGLLAKRGDVRPVVVTESAGLENSLRDLTNGCVSRILIGRKRRELQIKRAKHRTESS